jgi:hypothetical protein
MNDFISIPLVAKLGVHFISATLNVNDFAPCTLPGAAMGFNQGCFFCSLPCNTVFNFDSSLRPFAPAWQRQACLQGFKKV